MTNNRSDAFIFILASVFIFRGHRLFSVSPIVINISPRAIDASNLFASEAFNLLRQQKKGTHLCLLKATGCLIVT